MKKTVRKMKNKKKNQKLVMPEVKRKHIETTKKATLEGRKRMVRVAATRKKC